MASKYKRIISLLSTILFLSILVVLSFKEYKENLKVKYSSSIYIDNISVKRNIEYDSVKLYGSIDLNVSCDSINCILLNTDNNNEIILKDEISKIEGGYKYVCFINLDSLNNNGNYMLCFKTEKDNKITLLKTNYIVYSNGKIVEE